MVKNDYSSSDGQTLRDVSAAGGGRRLVAGDTILCRYTVMRELGEGGMGIVYQCLDTVGGVEVAMKCLPPEVSHNEDEMEDIRANYQIVRKLRHPNIAGAATLERDSATGDYYLVMDLASGVSLKRWMKRNPQATAEAKLAILRQVAAALDYAHAEKVVHRDVKPENVMVDDDGRVKVLDFGLAAQIRSSQSRTSDTVTSKGGTPGYKSPEQWLGRPQREPADVYSFGVMAYWMFAGALPFDGDDPVVLGHAVLTAPVEPIPDLPAHMNAALVKALAKKPEERFASCGELVDALEGKDLGRVEHAEGGNGRARSPSGLQSARSRAAVKGLLAVAALGLAVFGGWWWASRRNGTTGANGTTGTNVVHVSPVSEVPSSASQKPGPKPPPDPADYRKSEDAKSYLRPDKVQLWKNGPYWADRNVGAAKPEDYGNYFWWGDIVGYTREGDSWVASNRSSRDFSFDGWHSPTYDKSIDKLERDGWLTVAGVLEPEHDAARVQWGDGWRMPTEQELDDLVNNCDWTWTTVNGVNGYAIHGKGDYASARIFLPCAGYGDGTSLCNAGLYGYYWSSVPGSDSYYSWGLDFFSSSHYESSSYRSLGQSIRPVAAKEAAAKKEPAKKEAAEPAAPTVEPTPTPAATEKPAEEVKPAETPAGRTHVVKEGEDLVQIAINYTISPSVLIDLNDLQSEEVKPGQILKLPPNAKVNQKSPSCAVGTNGTTGTNIVHVSPVSSGSEVLSAVSQKPGSEPVTSTPLTQKKFYHPGGYVKNQDGKYVWQNGSYKDTPPLDPADNRKSEDAKSYLRPKADTTSTPAGFTDNLNAALAKAKAEGKLVYACFSGSDWCYWCKKLEKEVLSDPLFVASVMDDYVLVFIDSPQNKAVLSDHAKAENKKLTQKYGISGFPTALILDGDGKKVGETGYRQGGAAKYAEHLMDFRKK